MSRVAAGFYFSELHQKWFWICQIIMSYIWNHVDISGDQTRWNVLYMWFFFPTWFVNKLNSETQPEPIKAPISLDFSSHFSAAVQESLLSIQD